MRKIISITVMLLMIFAVGTAALQAQQTDARKVDCPMMSHDGHSMAKAHGMKCSIGEDGKCPMRPENCPMQDHHRSETFAAPDKGAS